MAEKKGWIKGKKDEAKGKDAPAEDKSDEKPKSRGSVLYDKEKRRG